MTEKIHNNRFDRLLKAMLGGTARSAGKKPSAGPALDEEQRACSSDTQTRPDTSGDVSK
jgi:hypothetical protein